MNGMNYLINGGRLMNSIEFKLIREELHLSQTELAELWGVALRTLQRWEKGDFQIPQNKQEELIKYLNQINFCVRKFMLKLNELKATKNDTIVLLAYNKNDYDGDFDHYKLHNAVILKCKETARINGYENIRICKFDPKAYFYWLKDRKDTQNARSQWASLQFAM